MIDIIQESSLCLVRYADVAQDHNWMPGNLLEGDWRRSQVVNGKPIVALDVEDFRYIPGKARVRLAIPDHQDWRVTL